MTSSASTLQPLASRSAIASMRRADAYTRLPVAAKRSAVERPMPEEQPVIRTAWEAGIVFSLDVANMSLAGGFGRTVPKGVCSCNIPEETKETSADEWTAFMRS